MTSLREAVINVEEVRVLVGRFLNVRGDVEKLKQLSKEVAQDLFEVRYPIVGTNSATSGSVTYLG